MIHLVGPQNSGKVTFFYLLRGGSRAAATSKMEHFVIIANGFRPLTIITRRSILDVAAVLDPPLLLIRMDMLVFRKILPKQKINVRFSENLAYMLNK